MSDLKPLYIDAVGRLQRLHHQLLDLVKSEFERMDWSEITPAQAMMLFNIGAGNEVRSGDVRGRGYYLGSNASYNLKKLRDGGYLERRPNVSDHRVVKIALTPKGEEVAEVVDDLFQRQLRAVGEVTSDLDADTLQSLNDTMNQLERFWALRAQIDLSQPRTA